MTLFRSPTFCMGLNTYPTLYAPAPWRRHMIFERSLTILYEYFVSHIIKQQRLSATNHYDYNTLLLTFGNRKNLGMPKWVMVFYRKDKNATKENQFFSLPHEANSLISKNRLVSITIFQINIYCVQRASEIASNLSITLDFRKPYKKLTSFAKTLCKMQINMLMRYQ